MNEMQRTPRPPGEPATTFEGQFNGGLDLLEKVISAGEDLAVSIEETANRLIGPPGPKPERPGNDRASETPDCSSRRFALLLDRLIQLQCRIGYAAKRLS